MPFSSYSLFAFNSFDLYLFVVGFFFLLFFVPLFYLLLPNFGILGVLAYYKEGMTLSGGPALSVIPRQQLNSILHD